MDIASFQLRAGDVDTAGDLYAALQALQVAIGATALTQGLQDSDIPGPVPNQAFDAMAYLQGFPWRSYMVSGEAGGFPITSILWPTGGTLAYLLYQTTFAHVLVIGKAGKVAFVTNVAARPTFPDLIGPIGIDGTRGVDVLTICNYVAGTALPTVGDPLGEERWERFVDYTPLFLPSDP